MKFVLDVAFLCFLFFYFIAPGQKSQEINENSIRSEGHGLVNHTINPLLSYNLIAVGKTVEDKLNDMRNPVNMNEEKQIVLGVSYMTHFMIFMIHWGLLVNIGKMGINAIRNSLNRNNRRQFG